MKLFYDISVLGSAAGSNAARTGIFRVVENVALQLAKHPEITLQFTAQKYLRAALEYIESHPDICKTPLSYTDPALYLDGLKSQLSRRIQTSNFPDKQILQLARSLASGSHKILSKIHGEGNVKRIDGDIFHSPYFPLPTGIRAKYRFITVYDLIPILHPQYFEFQKNHLLHRVIKSIDRDTWIFCISEATKNDLLNYHPNVDPQKIAIIPLGASKLFFQCQDKNILLKTGNKYGIPDQPYFLSLSTLEPRKNIESTVKAFVRLIREENTQNINLVLVGTKGWDFGKIFDEISGCRELKDRIIVTGYVDDRDLAALYSGALAFVYPSYYEGFGLPPLEAMQCGVPVITANTSSLPEVVGDAGIQVNPDDNDALCQAMLELLNNGELCQELSIRSLERAKLFAWEACADITIDHYHRAMGTTRINW